MIPAPNEVIAGKYRVESQLGEGGMAVVLAATHEALRQRVAIKIVQPQFVGSTELKERFFREARALAALRSPHVARIFDVGALENGATYLVLEYLEGLDLHRVLQQNGALSPRDAATYLLQAAEGLSEAHQLGILHRDLKPSNLFLSALPTGEPCIKILDFGLAKLTEEGVTGLTEREDVMGSPSYMAPEQIRGLAQADARSDVWSLGVTLYELLTDTLPFEGANATKIAAAVLTEPPIALETRRPNLPHSLVRIAMDCMVKDPEKRTASAKALADRLRAFLAAPELAKERKRPEPSILAGLSEPSRKSPSGRGSDRGRRQRDGAGEATYGGMLPLAPLDPSDDATIVMSPPAPRAPSEGQRTLPQLVHPLEDKTIDDGGLDEGTIDEKTIVRLPPLQSDQDSEEQTVLRPRDPEPPRELEMTTVGPARPAMPTVMAEKIDWRVPIAVGLSVAIFVVLVGLAMLRLR